MSKQEVQYWLMKSEPEVFSFADLKSKKTTYWDGVRNYMARNFMMRDMRVGDMVLFYHSNAKPSGVVGIAKVTAPARPDASAFDKNSEYYDEKSTLEKPRWYCVEVGYHSPLPSFVSLEDIKKNPRLKKMLLLNNSRLSVQPVTKIEYDIVCAMSKNEDPQ